MSKVVLNEVDDLNAVLSITIEKKDYLAKLNSQLEKYRKEAHMKGFRKGKTPLSVVQKLYGKSLLGEIINEKISTELQDFLESGAVEVAAYPIPVEDHQNLDFDLKSLDDFTFEFSIGKLVMPEVKGLSAEDTYEDLKLEPSAEEIGEQWKEIQKSVAAKEDKTGPIEEGDKISLVIPSLFFDQDALPETPEGEEEKTEEVEAIAVNENEEVVEVTDKDLEEAYEEDEEEEDYDEEDEDDDDLENSFSILVNDIYDEKLKQEFLSKSVGDKLTIDLRLLENQDESFIKRYYLKDEAFEVAPEYEVEIVSASRQVIPEINQELFDKVFGEGEVQSKEAADAKIAADFRQATQGQLDALLLEIVRRSLLEKNTFALPEDFLRRWLKLNNEKMSDARVEKEFPKFLESLRWSHIKNKILKDAGTEITREEILEVFRKQIMSYFGGGLPAGMESFVNNYAQQMMEKEENVRGAINQLEDQKLVYLIRANTNLLETKLTFEEFKEKIKSFNATLAAEEEEE
ncbi:MAG TPA: trigger factor family protein [Saprospiraceae bacterium]|nr:trigger factor family protein [Saprospiraceae bacterium]HMQ84012.1 trigger factor family protein [Saprospiraceae bacterium]